MKLNFPSCKFVNKAVTEKVKTEYNAPPYNKLKVFEPLSWQNTLSDFCKENGRYIQLNAPGGCGKTTWAAYNSVVESIDTDNSRKMLFLAPMTTICDSYSETLYFNYKGKKRKWNVSHRYGSGSNMESIRMIKEFLSIKVVPGISIMSAASVTHQGWVQFWDSLTLKEKKKLLQDVTIYIDECHHCKNDENKEDIYLDTRLGSFLRDVLDINNSTCKIILMTATMFRGDEKDIIPKKYQKKFKSWNMSFEDYMEILQIDKFNFDYVAYDKDPLNLIISVMKKHIDKRHIVVLPAKGIRFRNEETLKRYMESFEKIFKKERILDLVTPETQEKNKPLLKKKPEDYDLIVACNIMVEGSDWPPASVLHNTRLAQSVLLSTQISFRLFRRYDKKNEIWVYNYLPEEMFTDGVRKVFSDRLNFLVFQILMSEHCQPLKIPLLPHSPYRKKHNIYREYQVPLSSIVSANSFIDLIRQINSAHDLEYHELGYKKWMKRRFKKLALEFYREHGLKKHISEKSFIEYVYKKVFRIDQIARGKKEDVDKIDLSFMRKKGDFDKVWEKTDLLGSFVMGTQEPINKEDMEYLRKFCDKYFENLKIQASETTYEEALERYEKEEKIEIDRKIVTTGNSSEIEDYRGKWIQFDVPEGWKPNGKCFNGSLKQYGLVISQNEEEIEINFYMGDISLDQENRILLTIEKKKGISKHIYCGNYWRPLGVGHPYNVSTKLLKKYFFENSNDLYGGRKPAPKIQIKIPVKWIVRTLTYKGGEL